MLRHARKKKRPGLLKAEPVREHTMTRHLKLAGSAPSVLVRLLRRYRTGGSIARQR